MDSSDCHIPVDPEKFLSIAEPNRQVKAWMEVSTALPSQVPFELANVASQHGLAAAAQVF